MFAASEEGIKFLVNFQGTGVGSLVSGVNSKHRFPSPRKQASKLYSAACMAAIEGLVPCCACLELDNIHWLCAAAGVEWWRAHKVDF
jgi:hypothetical protein